MRQNAKKSCTSFRYSFPWFHRHKVCFYNSWNFVYLCYLKLYNIRCFGFVAYMQNWHFWKCLAMTLKWQKFCFHFWNGSHVIPLHQQCKYSKARPCGLKFSFKFYICIWMNGLNVLKDSKVFNDFSIFNHNFFLHQCNQLFIFYSHKLFII